MENNKITLEELEKRTNNIINIIKEKNPNEIENNDNILYLEFYNLLKENIEYQKNITYIFHTISKAISSSEKEDEKESLLKLLPEFFIPFKDNISLTFPFLSRILTTIQSNINSNINKQYISQIFKEIIIILFNENYEIDINQNKQNYEICQGFCIYNMKQNDDFCQICGVLCLKELIINLNFYLNNSKYMKYLWEKLILFIENDNFSFKINLLQCFKELINKSKEKFKQYANITMYKILDYLQDSNIDFRKEALNILYLLILYCPKDISSLKNQLIDFISSLKEENNEFILEKCNEILKLLNNNEKFIDNKNLSCERRKKYSENLNKINKMKKNVRNENMLFNNNEIDDFLGNQKPKKNIKKEKESIFKTPKNKEFFEKANKVEDIYIVDSLHQNFKSNYLEKEKENEKEEYNNSKEEINENNKNDYMISLNNLSEKKIEKKNEITYNDYSELIKKMADLSEKQIFLIDCISQLRKDFSEAILNLNNRVDKIEKFIPNENNNLISQSINFISSNFLQKLIDENNLNEIINYLIKVNSNELKEIPNQTLENIIYYFIHKIQNEKNIPLDKIISILKKCMISIKNQISNECIQNLEHTLKILLNDENMEENNIIEIKLILSFLKG